MVSFGIYCWRNNITGRVLVGQTGSTHGFHKRKVSYLGKLRRGVYANKHFQRSWNKYGEAAFDYIILEVLKCDTYLTAYEQSYLDYYRTLPSGVYNQAGPADCPVRGAKLGPLTLAQKEMRSLRQRGSKRPPRTAEWRRKKSEAERGKVLSEETKQKIRASNLGKRHSASARAKIAAYNLGRKLSSESKNKISAARRRRISTPCKESTKLKMSAANKGRKLAPCTNEYRSMLSELMRHRWKGVERINLTTGEVKEYNCISAVKKDGFSNKHVSECCLNKRKTHKGYGWQYLNNGDALCI